jgi:hypothetical protein
MFPSFWLPVIPWINVSAPLCKAAQIFCYGTFSLPLPLAVLLPYYCIQDTEFYLEFFLGT